MVSLGAAGTVFAVHHEALKDPTATVTAFADATGRHLPVVQVRNAVRTLRATAELLGTDLAGLSELALQSTPGAYGLVLLPYLEGERTPDLPHTAGTLSGLRRDSMKREHLARAAFEGMLCGLADALDVLRIKGVEVHRVFLLGAAAELPAVQALAPALFGTLVVVPPPAEYAAIGAARQAAWSLGAVLGSQSQSEPRTGRGREPCCSTRLTARRPRARSTAAGRAAPTARATAGAVRRSARRCASSTPRYASRPTRELLPRFNHVRHGDA